mmetsp:Transcript_9690/g.18192  ORF Transcript_9690/g.18192 Transcript_9690/m.18192 type:complete len:642 (-) Transcript_9690:450-2375(-)|eukprot:CAMPEP_0176497474 /NCGR_PEP_ID=MMETSP0200_2-20121128/11740_1 /TAXON_ID=947934 /ORGANISM="Chaetoceros sp., Strain GSL56" /LENGTH=641 /DNA_ID=CAMNT_0017895483 /DNA_START=940 /DNA_END=2865 /DNA_ORIENTATION=-
MNINYNTSSTSSSIRKRSVAPTEFESQSTTATTGTLRQEGSTQEEEEEEQGKKNNLMACIANITRISVPTTGPDVSSIIMTRDRPTVDAGSSRHDHHHVDGSVGCGGNASVKSSLSGGVPSCRPQGPGTPAILKIPSTKANIMVARDVSSARKNKNHESTIGNHSILSVPHKSLLKKRGRSEYASSKNNDSLGFFTNISTAQEPMEKTEIELTKEQIDNVIDTTLPTNFSFSLPLTLSPSNRNKMTESQDFGEKHNHKKQRPNPPPLNVVFTKMDRVQPHHDYDDDDEDEEATPTPSQSSMRHSKTPTSGRWTRKEHEAFLEGLEIYGREWKKVAQRIPTRTSAQIRSHAQKYFAKLSRDEQSRTSLPQQGYVAGEEQQMKYGNVHGRGEVMQDDKVVEYPPSVLDRMEQILRDPLGAEIEVAQTLKRLRERYNDLHAKLQQQESNQDMQRNRLTLSSCTVATAQVPQRPLDHPTQSDVFSPIYNIACPNPNVGTKFTFLEQPTTTVLQEGSDRTSNVKQSPHDSFAPIQTPTTRRMTNAPNHKSRPCIRICNESLALHSKELIALSVLGGELYRSASHQDLSKAADPSLEMPSRPLNRSKEGSESGPGSGRHIMSYRPTLDSTRPPLGDNKSSDTDSKES